MPSGAASRCSLSVQEIVVRGGPGSGGAAAKAGARGRAGGPAGAGGKLAAALGLRTLVGRPFRGPADRRQVRGAWLRATGSLPFARGMQIT
jgi:hypothetical protein